MDVLIFTGFLGSGKTTLLLQTAGEILREGGRRLQIIENDAGTLSVDAALIRNHGISVKEIYAGCICCSLKEEFEAAVREIREQKSCDILLIEPSGIAGPDTLEDVFRPYDNIRVRTILVADCLRLIKEGPLVTPFLRRSIELAPFVLLNKLDLLPPEEQEECEKRIRQINGKAEILHHRKGHSAVPSVLRSLRTSSGERSTPDPSPSLLPPVSVLTEQLSSQGITPSSSALFLERFRQSLREKSAGPMGHIKLMIQGEGEEFMLLQMTDWESAPRIRRSWSHGAMAQGMVLNSLIPGLSDRIHRECFDRSLREFDKTRLPA